MKKKIGFGLIMIALLLGIAACGTHQGPHRLDQEKMMKRVTKKLDLNEGQQGKFRVVLENAAQLKMAWDANHSELSRVLGEQLPVAELDESTLNAQMSAMETEFIAFRRDMISDYAAFHATLDDSQRDKIAELFEKMGHHKRH